MQFSGVSPIVFSQLYKYTLFCLCITECRQHNRGIGYLLEAVAYPGILFGGVVQQIQLRTEDRTGIWGQ